MVSRAADFSRHQKVSPPRGRIGSYGTIPSRDTNRDTTPVELSNLSSLDVFARYNMSDRFETERFILGIQSILELWIFITTGMLIGLKKTG